MINTRLSIQKLKAVKVNRRQTRNKRIVNYAGMDIRKVDHTDLDYVPEYEDYVPYVSEKKPMVSEKPYVIRRKLLIKLKFLRRSPRFLRRSPRHLKQL